MQIHKINRPEGAYCASFRCPRPALKGRLLCELHTRKRTEETPTDKVIKASYFLRPIGKPSQIYAIKGADKIKFGIAADPVQRFSAIQSSSPQKVEMIGYMWGSSQIERDIHEYLKDDRAHGEWFNSTPRAIAISLLIGRKDLIGLLEFMGIEPNRKPIELLPLSEFSDD